MKDITGEYLNVGDRVVYEEVGYKGLCIGRILRFTPQQVVVVREKDKRVPPEEILRPQVVLLKPKENK